VYRIVLKKHIFAAILGGEPEKLELTVPPDQPTMPEPDRQPLKVPYPFKILSEGLDRNSRHPAILRSR